MIEMSTVIEAAVAALNDKLGSADFDGSAKFVIEGEGAVVVDASGARASDEDTLRHLQDAPSTSPRRDVV